MSPAVASVFWRHRRTQEDDCGRNFKGPIEGSPLCCPLRFSANSSSIIPSYDPLPVVSISEVNGDGFVSRGPVASSSLGWASHLGSMSRFRPAPDGLATAADGQKRANNSQSGISKRSCSCSYALERPSRRTRRVEIRRDPMERCDKKQVVMQMHLSAQDETANKRTDAPAQFPTQREVMRSAKNQGAQDRCQP